MKYISPIDPHVHARWTEYPDHDFLGMALTDAKAVGLAALIEMPNTTPALTTPNALSARHTQVEEARKALGVTANMYAHVGMTADSNKCQTAINLVRKRRFYTEQGGGIFNTDGLPVGCKIFFTHSTGNMGILDPVDQKMLWETLAATGYDGVVLGHFEDETHFAGEFNYLKPVSHSLFQNPIAEFVQVEQQLRMATDAKFCGTFYVAHASAPDTVSLLTEAKRSSLHRFKIVIEATWHHLFLNTDSYSKHGNCVKMNPPLRSPHLQHRLLEQAINGLIDIIGTDHAPHPLERKLSSTPPSGIPALPFWPRGIELLRGYGICEGRLERMIFETANAIFQLGEEAKTVECEYNSELWDKYGWNPFSLM